MEYLLLFSLGLALALLISSQMVSRNPDEPGFLITKWQSLKDWIGKDDPGRRTDNPRQ